MRDVRNAAAKGDTLKALAEDVKRQFLNLCVEVEIPDGNGVLNVALECFGAQAIDSVGLPVIVNSRGNVRGAKRNVEERG